jgi:hypothetical protein
MENLRPEFIERALVEIESVKDGTCLIMKGTQLLTKQSYLKSWKRAMEFSLNYNAARLAVRITARSRPGIVTGWNAIEQSDAGN